MNEAVFLIAGMALFSKLSERPFKGWRPAVFFLQEAAWIFLATACFYVFAQVLKFADPFDPMERAITLMPLAYIYSKQFKKTEAFFVVVCTFSFYVVARPYPLTHLLTLWALLFMTAGFAFARLCLDALAERLLFSDAPEPWAGLPVFLAGAALIMLIVTGLSGLLPLGF